MDTFTVQSKQRGELIDITAQIQDSLARANVLNGLGVVYLMHTTAGLTINDHLDPAVAHDILLALDRAVPRDQPGFEHRDKDSDAHTKASMMGSSVTVVVENGRLALGRWQGIFLCEFDGPRSRSVKIAWMSLERADQLHTTM